MAPSTRVNLRNQFHMDKALKSSILMMLNKLISTKNIRAPGLTVELRVLVNLL